MRKQNDLFDLTVDRNVIEESAIGCGLPPRADQPRKTQQATKKTYVKINILKSVDEQSLLNSIPIVKNGANIVFNKIDFSEYKNSSQKFIAKKDF